VATPEELQFARFVLKKGWVPKTTLEEALREVNRLRREDPAVTLAGYLEEKGLLSPERIEEASAALAEGLTGAEARPRAAARAAKTPRAKNPEEADSEEEGDAEAEDEGPDTLAQTMVGWLRNTPFWASSAILHLVLLVLFMNVVYTREKKGGTEVSINVAVKPVIKPKPPAYDPTLKRDMKRRRPVPGPKDANVKDPVILKREVEDVTPDIPLGTSLDNLTNVQITEGENPQGINDAIGVGGGGAAAYGQRWGKGSLKREGGSEGSEEAVRASLEWLRRHQSADGHWSCRDFTEMCDKQKGPCKIHPKNPDPAGGDGRGWKEHDIGVTALAILAYTGYGHTHRTGTFPEYVEVLKKACSYIKGVQIKGTGDPNYDGAFRHKETIPQDKSKETDLDEETEWMYDHAIATMAMGELLVMSNDVIGLKQCVEDAATFCIRAQLEGSGWRYSVKSPVSDTSVTGWMVLALKTVKSCRLLGLVSRPTEDELDRAFRGALTWFDNVTSKETGITGYRAPGDPGSMLTELSKRPGGYPFSKELSCMTAVSVLCRLFGGESRTKDDIKRGVGVLLKHTPKWQLQKGKVTSTINMYYWYYATLAMFQFGGGFWKEWNKDMQEALLGTQRRYDDTKEGGCEDGSWDPIDEWSLAGGRVYTTAIGALTLEVYYRYERATEGKGL
jgi:hypothetical protein